MRHVALLFSLLVLPSCFVARVHENRPLDAGAYAQLAVGTSTASDAAQLLGAPTQVVELGAKSAWLYRYGATKRAGLFLIVVGFLNDDSQSDRVWLFFDANGVLEHAAASFEADAAQWEMPWGDEES